jgi:hypothetical protein
MDNLRQRHLFNVAVAVRVLYLQLLGHLFNTLAVAVGVAMTHQQMQ